MSFTPELNISGVCVSLHLCCLFKPPYPMLYRDIRAFHRNSEPMGDRSPLASGEITPSDPHRLTMQTLTTKLDNSSILKDAREAAEMAA